MPFYEYQCKSCGHELEAMQKVSDPLLRKCPHCGKSQLTRLMSAPVFRLKGGGWYETDFKGDKDNQRNLADRPEDAPKETKETDTKAKDEKGKDDKGKDGKEAKSARPRRTPHPRRNHPPLRRSRPTSPRISPRAARHRNRPRERAGPEALGVPSANPSRSSAGAKALARAGLKP